MLFLSANFARDNIHLPGSIESGHFFFTLAENFLYSGTSALFLLIANLFPHYWYLSFIALFPFLWKISKASPKEGFRLGLLLGLSFFLFGNLDILLTSPISAILKILGGTLLFALWGWTVGWARQYFEFNPIIVAGLWVFLELLLIKLGYTSGLLTRSTPSTPFLLRLTTLFGFGIISFIIVLLNSILVRAVEYAVEILKVPEIEFITAESFVGFTEGIEFISQRFFLTPQMRGPPVSLMLRDTYDAILSFKTVLKGEENELNEI